MLACALTFLSLIVLNMLARESNPGKTYAQRALEAKKLRDGTAQIHYPLKRWDRAERNNFQRRFFGLGSSWSHLNYTPTSIFNDGMLSDYVHSLRVLSKLVPRQLTFCPWTWIGRCRFWFRAVSSFILFFGQTKSRENLVQITATAVCLSLVSVSHSLLLALQYDQK